MKRNLFAYGTLLVPDIWDLVVGESFRSEPAVLPEFEVFRVIGGDFPGITKSERADAKVPGRVYFDLDEITIARLDAYEGTFYERLKVECNHKESDEQIHCDTYIIPKPAAEGVLSVEVWTLEWFQAEAQDAYIGRMRGARF